VEIRARFIVLCYLWTDTIGVFVFGLWARGGLVSTVLYSYKYSYSTARYRDMLLPLYFPDRLLQPIRTLGFATLNTTFYRENPSLTVAFFAFGLVVLPSGG